ncbi:hypothetical protein FOVG_07563 [Fusarium oxysporum f. sp. pisi HDV247]|uniref:Uncharacterized protein n=1 Tax=Fusarium oxysporum f. sp. pisi HDV247 TaxID=1080344 RepID=W9PRB6_FUSOX|nr:hypothetical protein FOVG_07563 [Fusarium oxysporum f. sp. pisi HDV247]
MALSAEAIISIVGTIINLPSCVLAFYHMCKGQKKDHHKDTRYIEQGHKLPQRMTHYSGYYSIWNQHPDYPSPWVSYIVPSRFRGYDRVQRGPAWTF